jgi:membrane-associated protein
MQFVSSAWDFLTRIDRHIESLIVWAGGWSYIILFLLIFAQVAFVVMPFIPGNTLLFAIGVFCNPAREGHFNVWLIAVLLTLAAVAGEQLNYFTGKWAGGRLERPGSAFRFSEKHLSTARGFFDRYGSRAILLAQWIPFVRTIAPFLAGVGRMEYRKFSLFTVIGAFLWVWICVWAGHWFGQFRIVEESFSVVILVLVLITFAPPMIHALFKKIQARRATAAE